MILTLALLNTLEQKFVNAANPDVNQGLEVLLVPPQKPFPQVDFFHPLRFLDSKTNGPSKANKKLSHRSKLNLQDSPKTPCLKMNLSRYSSRKNIYKVINPFLHHRNYLCSHTPYSLKPKPLSFLKIFT